MGGGSVIYVLRAAPGNRTATDSTEPWLGRDYCLGLMQTYIQAAHENLQSSYRLMAQVGHNHKVCITCMFMGKLSDNRLLCSFCDLSPASCSMP